MKHIGVIGNSFLPPSLNCMKSLLDAEARLYGLESVEVLLLNLCWQHEIRLHQTTSWFAETGSHSAESKNPLLQLRVMNQAGEPLLSLPDSIRVLT